MAEAAGPTNQEGITYQNTLAARYLADLLDLHRLSPTECVLEVRVEAPAHVDDIVVKYADGHRDWIQAKANLRRSGSAWNALWQDFAKQFSSLSFRTDDRLVLAIAHSNTLSSNLIALSERARASETEGEWRERLGKSLTETLVAVEAAVADPSMLHRLFQVVRIKVVTLEALHEAFERLDLGTASVVPKSLQAQLFQLASQGSASRMVFRGPWLRRALVDQFGADLFEPRDWGLAAYRQAVSSSCQIKIPGRPESAPVADLFVWPQVRRRDNAPEQGFEDELPKWSSIQDKGSVDLSRFPEADLQQCILLAGPGFGKSALIMALSEKLISTPLVPVEISLGAFADSDQSVLEYLETEINREFSIRVDWCGLAQRGLICVFFDGLDEVSGDKRPIVIRRINRFSGRFPDAAWMVTARDPAVLNGALPGQILELLPFDNPEISKFAELFKPWATKLDSWQFIRNLGAYPEVARLARIPLFLSIMLANWSEKTPLCTRRADVIDAYIHALFDNPKQSSASPIGSGELQRLAQALAFDSIEREEIGIPLRQAHRVLKKMTDHSSDDVVDQLIALGVLRKSAGARLQFPYPVVQEYLAAIHLVDELEDQIPDRIADVIRRPWAQVIQFALELVPDASEHIRRMLDLEDDLFFTGLRLIGRCVANGATVNADLRDEIGSELAEVWGSANHYIRDRVGPVLVDAYANPMHPEVRRRLSWPWLEHNGAADIVNDVGDPELTLDVTSQLLTEGLSEIMTTRPWQPALKAVTKQVVEKICERVNEPNLAEADINGLSSFLGDLRLDGTSPECLQALVIGDGYPRHLRLSAIAARYEPPNERELEFATKSLEAENWRERSSALDVLKRVADIEDFIGDLLTDPNLNSEAKEYLVTSLNSLIAHPASHLESLKRLLSRDDLAVRHRDVVSILLIDAGDRNVFCGFEARLSSADHDVVNNYLARMNWFPDAGISNQIVSAVLNRNYQPADLARIVNSITFGLTYRITQDAKGWSFYGFESAPRHPDWQLWMPCFDIWLSDRELKIYHRINILVSLVPFRPDLLSELELLVLSISDPDDLHWDEDEDEDEDEMGSVLRYAIRALSERRVLLPLELSETYANSKRPNLIYAAMHIIEAHATPAALDLLKKLHGEVESSNRSAVLNSMEIVSARLGVRLTKNDLS